MTPGPKKKPGNRYPCGKRTDPQRQEDIMQTAIRGRLNAHGLKADKVYHTGKDDPGMTGWAIAKTDILGSPLNKLLHWKMITQNQADAGHDFAKTMREYLSTAKLQKAAPSKAGFVPGAFDNGDGPDVRGATRAKAYMDALAEIDRLDPFSESATAIVWAVCYEEKERTGAKAIGALRVGLNEIHRIFYGKGKKAA